MSQVRSSASKVWTMVMVIAVGVAVIVTAYRLVAYVHDLAERRSIVSCLRALPHQQLRQGEWRDHRTRFAALPRRRGPAYTRLRLEDPVCPT